MSEGQAFRVNQRPPADSPYRMGSTGGRLQGWGWSNAGVNASIANNDLAIKGRARGLSRNNGYGWAAVESIVQRTVGPHGLLARPAGMKNRRNSKFLQAAWKRWIGDPKQVDFDRRLNFAALQDVVMREVVVCGHVLVRMLVDPTNPDNPLQLRVISSDFLADHLDRIYVSGGGEMYDGIEFDKWGRVAAYHLHRRNPHERSFANLLAVDRVPAEEILHVYRMDAAGQQIGITWMHPVGPTFRDRGLWSSAVLSAQQQAACVGVAVVDPGAETSGLTEEERNRPIRMHPGMTPVLQPGQDIKTISPPPAADLPEYDRSLLREAAAGLGVSYEALTGDLSQTNFSSARLGQSKFQTLADSWRHKMLIPQLLNPIWERWVSLMPRSRRSGQPVEVEWIPPKRELIDPQKEWQANLLAVRAGFLSLDDVIRQQTGAEATVTLEEIAAVNAEIDRLGLKLDSDPRANTQGAKITVEEPARTKTNDPSGSISTESSSDEGTAGGGAE